MVEPALAKRCVLPVVRRHAEDAAVLWTQLEAPERADHLPARQALDFGEYLLGHLQGLQIAGPPGFELCLEALRRWRKPGEVFAALRTALSLHDGHERDEACAEVFQVVRETPALLLRGAISALAWEPCDNASAWCSHAQASQDPVLRVAALRASARRELPVPGWADHLRHARAEVRAAGCRCAPLQALPALETLSDDPDLPVRAEATLAWARLVPHDERSAEDAALAASRLWRCVSALLAQLAQASGWTRLQVERRLSRWMRHLAWLVPLGHTGIPQLLQQMPMRLALDFVLHHGDADQLPFVLQALHHPEQARWAGWVWQCLTGVDLQAASLILPDPELDLDAPLSQIQHDADRGLPLPDPSALAAHPASQLRLPQGHWLLMGHPGSAPLLRALLDPAANQTQALRAVAAHALAQLHPGYALNLHASPTSQAAALCRMGLQA